MWDMRQGEGGRGQKVHVSLVLIQNLLNIRFRINLTSLCHLPSRRSAVTTHHWAQLAMSHSSSYGNSTPTFQMPFGPMLQNGPPLVDAHEPWYGFPTL